MKDPQKSKTGRTPIPATGFGTAPGGSPVRVLTLALALVLVVLAGCRSIREVANLRNVNFRIDRVEDARLAGIDLSGIETYGDVGASDMLRLSAAIADGEMPLDFTVHVAAENPSANSMNARLTKMDWTLLLEDEETVSGTFDREVVLRPGEPQDVPVEVKVDLVRFFDDNLRSLVNLALAVSGGETSNVKLRVQPTIRTPVGPMKYPDPITVVDEDVGRSSDGSGAASPEGLRNR
jgi:hypothetical protein